MDRRVTIVLLAFAGLFPLGLGAAALGLCVLYAPAALALGADADD